MYISQSFFHSLIAAVIINGSMHAWKIADPFIRQRFRCLMIVLSIFLFPVYTMINPERGSIYFRLEALIDFNRWLNLELWGKMPLRVPFIIFLAVTAAIFIFQEVVPLLRHMRESKKNRTKGKKAVEDPYVRRALEGLPVEKPDTFILDDDEIVLFSTTGKEPAVFLSTGLARLLDTGQLQAALAHEIAHVNRSRRPVLIVLFLLRIVMFFNPVILLEFRKLVQDEETICDCIAVSMLQKPHALAETLRKLYDSPEETGSRNPGGFSNIRENLENYGHALLIENRIKRLEKGHSCNDKGGWGLTALTGIVIILINYFVV